ncbi:MAG: ABC transporter ATP-binding protein [Acidobacteria bacterium]|nr:MAG: ABC transporter ATP-binding protein [Acidobacteriota bacterium]PYQ66100.1 MAG: ABC transporter ATP-binding protein [Acidobacteriota bacterium]
MTPERVIEVERLTKRFGEVTAVDDLSFSARRGEILGLLGPNGAGKTTTIQLLLGLTTPTTGAIRLFGLPLREHRRQILQRVNFSSAYISLPFNLSVRENLDVFGRLYGVRNRRHRIAELLELFEIPEVVDSVTGKLSSGQVTRVNLCKAFLNDPEILFLDEPTASLDPDIAEKVRAALKSVQRERGVTMVYTSHNMREIELVCDRVIFLSHGKLVAQGTPREILERADSESLERVFITIARGGRLEN